MAKRKIQVLLVATPEELSPEIRSEILRMDKKCFPHDIRCKPEGKYWWIVYVGNQLAGFASLAYKPTYTGVGYLYRVGVLPKFRGRGLHSRLVQARLKYARKIGLTKVITYTSAANCMSANNLIDCGFRLYIPQVKWGFKDGLYFYKDL